MDMTELIEIIDSTDKPLDVYITKETYELVQEPGNNRFVTLNDFRIVLHNKEDAMAALFDADIFGWSIKNFTWCNTSCDICCPWIELEVTLFKTTC